MAAQGVVQQRDIRKAGRKEQLPTTRDKLFEVTAAPLEAEQTASGSGKLGRPSTNELHFH
jgi:hypothetical protein